MKKLTDNFNRVHDYLRISLTDKCNLNCIYCNPDNQQHFGFNKENILSYEEILKIIRIFTGSLQFKKIRFTGGEPLVRKGVFELFNEVRKIKDELNFEIGITTNGTLLNGNSLRLKNSGIEKLNISLDSLKQERFYKITGRDNLQNVLNSIDESEAVGFNPVKINVVVIKNINHDEILDFVEFVKNRNLNIRFIEFMPFGNNQWERDGFISYKEMKEIIESKYLLEPLTTNSNEVAKDFSIADYKGKVSFITSMSEHFCGTCNRLRISSNGKMRLCLFSTGEKEIDFKYLLRNNYSDEKIIELLYNAVRLKWEKHPEPEELAELEHNNMLTIGG
jgi:GTP 3',8-cyclase / cyclic pyranopterin monophosphate synthase